MFIRLLKSLFPLLKDIFLEGKSIREAAKDNRGKLLVLIGVLLSLMLNYVLIPRVFSLSARVVELEKQLKKEVPVIPYEIPEEEYNRLDYYRNSLSIK